jgi:DnaJ homolog subfamily C member 16
MLIAFVGHFRNKTLMFAHMLIDKGATWYAELLRLSLSESRDLNINPRNCVGTVLALNGHRKYFCMYHAKHPESNRGAKVCCKKNNFTLDFLNKTALST